MYTRWKRTDLINYCFLIFADDTLLRTNYLLQCDQILPSGITMMVSTKHFLYKMFNR